MNIKKKDIIIIAVIILVAAASIILYLVYKSPGKKAVVLIGDEVSAELPLDKDTEYFIETPGGKNKLVIENGCAFVNEADCPDRICVKQGRIDETGESIICLPHKVIIEIR